MCVFVRHNVNFWQNGLMDRVNFWNELKYQQVQNAATANSVYNGQALLVKLKHDQLHSFNCIKWTWNQFGIVSKQMKIIFNHM